MIVSSSASSSQGYLEYTVHFFARMQESCLAIPELPNWKSGGVIWGGVVCRERGGVFLVGVMGEVGGAYGDRGECFELGGLGCLGV